MIKKYMLRIFEPIEFLERFIQHLTVYVFFKLIAGNNGESGEEDVDDLDNDYIGEMSNRFTRLRCTHWENAKDFELIESLERYIQHTLFMLFFMFFSSSLLEMIVNQGKKMLITR